MSYRIKLNSVYHLYDQLYIIKTSAISVTDETHLNSNSVRVLIADPLVALVGIEYMQCFIPDSVPALVRANL